MYFFFFYLLWSHNVCLLVGGILQLSGISSFLSGIQNNTFYSWWGLKFNTIQLMQNLTPEGEIQQQQKNNLYGHWKGIW